MANQTSQDLAWKQLPFYADFAVDDDSLEQPPSYPMEKKPVFYVEPVWKRLPELPAIEAVCRRVLKVQPEDVCTVEFFSAGNFNRVYLVAVPSMQKRLLLRVSLPVDLHHKTEGEVVILEWIRRHTQIPVPEIIAHDSSSDNEIGFEWIMMSLMPGTTANSTWRKMSMEAKEAFTRQMAEYQVQITEACESTLHLQSIGTLVRNGPDSDGICGDALKPGRLVAVPFFESERLDYQVARGPFPASYHRLDSYLRLIEEEAISKALSTKHKEEREGFERRIETAERLHDVLCALFPPPARPEATVLCHQELSLRNILVDEHGAITAVLDWEFVSAVPYWVATEYPAFLDNWEREEEPLRDEYPDEDQSDLDWRLQFAKDGDETLESEGKTDDYWMDLMEYEMTQLRKTYTEHMRELKPTWEADRTRHALRRDFLEALERCAACYTLGSIKV